MFLMLLLKVILIWALLGLFKCWKHLSKWIIPWNAKVKSENVLSLNRIEKNIYKNKC